MKYVSLFVLLLLLPPVRADAALVYQLSFTDDGTPLVAPFSGAQGAIIEIPVYLVETGMLDPGESGLATGLQVYGASFDFDSGTQDLTDINPVAGFDGLNSTSGSSILFNRSPLSGGPGVDSNTFAGGESAFLGTLDLTLTTAGTSSIDLLPYSQGTNFEARLRNATADIASQVLVNAIGDSATVIVTAVPEPSSFALLGVACSAFAIRNRRRKNR